MTTPGALDGIARLAARMPSSAIVGAGTVLDADVASACIDRGAQFIVSPVCRPPLIETCHRHDVVVMPGCLTPTEIVTAWSGGADFVKVFPASVVTPAFIRDVHGPLPGVKLIPTGGIRIDEAADWLRAGAAAVGIGGALVDAKAVAAGDLSALTVAAQRLVAAVRDIRIEGPAAPSGDLR
jgi:2-dehydro-3-deoxyphosphogluconate aldolase/(4S)-4-hydroxy-2-oxoglutarate aldolase